MPETNDLTTLVPQGLIRRLKTFLTERIKEAVGRCRFNEADEDSLTGAPGHVLRTPQRTIVAGITGAVCSFFNGSDGTNGKGAGKSERGG